MHQPSHSTIADLVNLSQWRRNYKNYRNVNDNANEVVLFENYLNKHIERLHADSQWHPKTNIADKLVLSLITHSSSELQLALKKVEHYYSENPVFGPIICLMQLTHKASLLRESRPDLAKRKKYSYDQALSLSKDQEVNRKNLRRYWSELIIYRKACYDTFNRFFKETQNDSEFTHIKSQFKCGVEFTQNAQFEPLVRYFGSHIMIWALTLERGDFRTLTKIASEVNIPELTYAIHVLKELRSSIKNLNI